MVPLTVMTSVPGETVTTPVVGFCEMVAEGTEAIVLGCLSFLGLAQPLAEMLGVPVIDPAIAAVCTAESTVHQNLLTSKISYPLLCNLAKERIVE